MKNTQHIPQTLSFKEMGKSVTTPRSFLSSPTKIVKALACSSFLYGSLWSGVPLYAQELGSSAEKSSFATIMNQLDMLKEENRELHGKVEELSHQVSLLQQRVETFSSDVEYRLNAPKGEIAVGEEPSSQPEEEGSLSPKPHSSTPGDEYKKALSLLEEGKYEAAEEAFEAFIRAYPKDKLAGAAQYWIGVTFFAREEHEKAAAHFAKGHKQYPHSSKAAENLLKLAKSLYALDRKTDACTTLEQLASTHPKAFKEEVSAEQKKMECK